MPVAVDITWAHMRISTFEGQGEAGTGGTRQRDQLSRVERVEWGIPGFNTQVQP